MKHHFLIIITCFCAFRLLAQSDTSFISSSTSVETFAPSVALTEARTEVLKLQEPVKTLFKFNLLGLSPITTGRAAFGQTGDVINSRYWPIDLEFSVEQKIGKPFSIGATIATSAVSYNGYNPDIFRKPGRQYFQNASFEAEGRWYYAMTKRINAGKQANNLSGPYLGASFRWIHWRKDVVLENTVNDQHSAFLNVGIQQRIFKHGYFDLGYGFGYLRSEESPSIRNNRYFSSALRAKLGFAIAGPSSKDDSKGSYCEALRCFREERSMFKIDLLNLINFSSYYYTKQLDFTPSIAWEQKIAQSAFSVETEASLSMSYRGFRYQDDYQNFEVRSDYQSFKAQLVIQPRYYFDLNRRIAKGTAGNNLSGPYVGLHNVFSKAWSNGSSSYALPTRSDINEYGIGLVVGCQYRFLRRGYVDFNIGRGKSTASGYIIDSVGNRYNIGGSWGKYLIGTFKVGVAF
jgi:hypothetical protein